MSEALFQFEDGEQSEPVFRENQYQRVGFVRPAVAHPSLVRFAALLGRVTAQQARADREGLVMADFGFLLFANGCRSAGHLRLRVAAAVRPRAGHARGDAPLAVIYARYSSENQSAASIEAQHEICRRYVEQHGWKLTRFYDDAAISGASAKLRPSFQQMVADAEAGRFSIIVVEAIDRLGRNLLDVAGLFDRLSFLGVHVRATCIG